MFECYYRARITINMFLIFYYLQYRFFHFYDSYTPLFVFSLIYSIHFLFYFFSNNNHNKLTNKYRQKKFPDYEIVDDKKSNQRSHAQSLSLINI